MMTVPVTITRVELLNFKAFTRYSLGVGPMNILVGPNNSGKSTILGSFRVLSAGFRRANARNADPVPGPDGPTFGHFVPTEDLPISLENAPTNYDTSKSTTVTFYLSNGNTLILYFPPEGGAVLIPMHASRPVKTTSSFRKEFPISIAAIPVLGPVEHKEAPVEKRTVQRGLATHRASRNFRNYWYHFPEDFEAFEGLIQDTWSQMDIKRLELIDYEFLAMFCVEDRIERELYWAGFGFQVWCQLLTHIVRAKEATLLIVDEPEIYLHPDLQRRLLTILREAGPDILMATHSTEIVSEADPSEILIVDKFRRTAQRLREPDQVQHAIELLGSTQNLTLAQLARTQRVLFVEGTDFRILSRLAQQLGLTELASKLDFTVVPVGGFSQWENVKAFAWGIEKTLSMSLMLGAVFDRDYRPDEEVEAIEKELAEHLRLSHIHKRKELENYLLVPAALDRAIRTRLTDYARRRGVDRIEAEPAAELLDRITALMRPEILSQYISYRLNYFKSSRAQNSSVTTDAIRIFDDKWSDINSRMEIVPGKLVFSQLNKYLAETYHISLTPTAVISQLSREEIPRDMVRLLRAIDRFRKDPKYSQP